MGVFPWLCHTGRLSRILSMMILEQAGLPLPVIHSIDRQDYYQALRSSDTRELHKLYLEAMDTTASSAVQVYAEAAAYRGHRAL